MDIPVKVKEKLLNHLMEFVSENKKQLFEKIILQRTKHITVVLEDIFQPHNGIIQMVKFTQIQFQ
jgi:predicted protein tyrosine phosphatase